MKQIKPALVLWGSVVAVIPAVWLMRADPPTTGHETANPQTTEKRTAAPHIQSEPGANAWNAGRPGGDWWQDIQRLHGHVGPWNVLGWRMGRAALRELKSEWGRHELEIICYVPLQTPFTCLVDGLAVGTGNSQGRMDLWMAEVWDRRQMFVAVRRKDRQGDVLEFLPRAAYLQSIINQPVEALDGLARRCAELPEKELFEIRRLPASP